MSLGFRPNQSEEEIIRMIEASGFTSNLALIYIETPANPTNELIDIRLCKTVADHFSTDDKQVLLAVDNTFMGPIWSHPLEHGAKSVDFFYQYENFSLVFTIVPLALVGFLIPLGAAFRLARFNLITEKVSFFRGVPTPAVALFIVALPLFIRHPLFMSINGFILTPIALTIIVALSVFFMNIHWKMIALKGFSRSDPWTIIFPLILLLISIVMFYILGLAALIIIIITYIVLSLLKNVLGI